jgi:hypothetical protein
MKRISGWREQASRDGSSPRRRPGKEKVDESDLVVGERDLGYQTPSKSSRTSSLETSTLVMTTTAARSCT